MSQTRLGTARRRAALGNEKSQLIQGTVNRAVLVVSLVCHCMESGFYKISRKGLLTSLCLLGRGVGSRMI